MLFSGLSKCNSKNQSPGHVPVLPANLLQPVAAYAYLANLAPCIHDASCAEPHTLQNRSDNRVTSQQRYLSSRLCLSQLFPAMQLIFRCLPFPPLRGSCGMAWFVLHEPNAGRPYLDPASETNRTRPCCRMQLSWKRSESGLSDARLRRCFPVTCNIKG